MLLYLNELPYKTLSVNALSPYTLSDLILEVREVTCREIDENNVAYYVENYEYICSVINTLGNHHIYLYSYCIVENEAIFYVNYEYYTATFYPADSIESIIYPSDYDVLRDYYYGDDVISNYMVNWYEVQYNQYNTVIYGEIIEIPREFTIKFVYNDQELEIIYDHNTMISDIKKQVRNYFTAEAGYSINWDFDLSYLPNVQIVTPEVKLINYEITFYDAGYNIIQTQTFTILDDLSSITINYPSVPEVDGKVGRWPEVNVTAYEDYYIYPVYESYYEIGVYYQDYDNNGEIIFEQKESISYTYSDLMSMSFIEFVNYHNLNERFNLPEKEHFVKIDYLSRLESNYEELKQYFGGIGVNIYYGYDLLQYSVVFSTENENSNGVGSVIYDQFLTYNIFSDLTSLEIPSPGIVKYHDTSWEEFEYFSSARIEVNQINTPIDYELHFDDGINTKVYYYNIYKDNHGDRYIQIRYENTVLLDDILSLYNNYSYIFDKPTKVNGYEGSWEEYKILDEKVTNVNAVYTYATYTIELYVPQTPTSSYYVLYDTIEYNLDNYLNKVIPTVTEKYYNTYWDTTEFFDFENKRVNLVYEAIEYEYNFYFNDELISSQKFTVENKYKTPYVSEEYGYHLSGWLLDGKEVNIYDLEYGNYDFYQYLVLDKYYLTYLDLDGNIYEVVEYDIENWPKEHIPFPEILGMDGAWASGVEINECTLVDINWNELFDYTIRPYYTSEGATSGLMYGKKTNSSLQTISYYVRGYEGDSKDVVVPEIYLNLPVVSIDTNVFNDIELNSLDIRHQTYYGPLNVNKLIMSDTSTQLFFNEGIKHIVVYPLEDGDRSIGYINSDLEILEVYSKNVTFYTNAFKEATSLHTLILDNYSHINGDDGLELLPQDISVKFLDLEGYLRYNNTAKFKDNITVYIGDDLLSSYTEITVPSSVSTLVPYKFNNTNIKKVTFEGEINIDYYSLLGVEEVIFNSSIKYNKLYGNAFTTVKEIRFNDDCEIGFDQEFLGLDIDRIYFASKLQLLTTNGYSAYEINDDVELIVNDEVINKVKYIVFDYDVTNTNYNLNYFNFIVYKNSSVVPTLNPQKQYVGDNIYFIDGIFYTVTDNKVSVRYVVDQENAVIKDSIVVSGTTYKVTHISPYALYRSEVNNLTMGNNITTCEEDSFYDSRCKNVYVPSLDYYFNLNRESFPMYSTPTCGGSNLYVDGKLFDTYVSQEGLKAIPDGIFFGCESLKTVILNEGVETIGCYTFEFTSITDLYLPASLRTIGYYAFTEVDKVHLASLESYVSNITYVKHYNANVSVVTPFECGGKLYINNELVTTLTIPNTVYKVADFAFDGLSGVEYLYVSDSVKYLGYYSFGHMADLKEVSVPQLSEYNNFFTNYCFKLNELDGKYYFGNETNPYAYLYGSDGKVTVMN